VRDTEGEEKKGRGAAKQANVNIVFYGGARRRAWVLERETGLLLSVGVSGVVEGSGGERVWEKEGCDLFIPVARCTVRRVCGEDKEMGGRAGLVGRGGEAVP
jgi:hypothetical protein